MHSCYYFFFLFDVKWYYFFFFLTLSGICRSSQVQKYLWCQKNSPVFSCPDKPVVDPGFSKRSGQKPITCSGRSAAGSFLNVFHFFESLCKKSYVNAPPPPGHPPPPLTTCRESLPGFLIETVYKTVMMFLMGEL